MTTQSQAPKTQTYAARRAGWVGGARVGRGKHLEMTEAQARYEPVDPVTPAAAATPAEAPKAAVKTPDAFAGKGAKS